CCANLKTFGRNVFKMPWQCRTSCGRSHWRQKKLRLARCTAQRSLALDRADIAVFRDITFLAAGPASERGGSAEEGLPLGMVPTLGTRPVTTFGWATECAAPTGPGASCSCSAPSRSLPA